MMRYNRITRLVAEDRSLLQDENVYKEKWFKDWMDKCKKIIPGGSYIQDQWNERKRYNQQSNYRLHKIRAYEKIIL